MVGDVHWDTSYHISQHLFKDDQSFFEVFWYSCVYYSLHSSVCVCEICALCCVCVNLGLLLCVDIEILWCTQIFEMCCVWILEFCVVWVDIGILWCVQILVLCYVFILSHLDCAICAYFIILLCACGFPLLCVCVWITALCCVYVLFCEQVRLLHISSTRRDIDQAAKYIGAGAATVGVAGSGVCVCCCLWYFTTTCGSLLTLSVCALMVECSMLVLIVLAQWSFLFPGSFAELASRSFLRHVWALMCGMVHFLAILPLGI